MAAAQPAAAQPAAAAAAPAAAVVEAEPAAEIDLERLQTLWPAVVDAVCERNAMVGALLRDARPEAVEAGRLVVAFPADAAFSKKKAEGNRDLVQEAVRGLTGASLAVSFSLSEHAVSSRPAILSEEELIERLRSELGAEEVFEDEPPAKD